MKNKLNAIIILMLLLVSCKSTNITGKYLTQPGWVTLLPTSATYYYSKANNISDTSANSLIAAQEAATNQITIWVENKAADYLISSNLDLDQSTAQSIVSSLHTEINEKVLKETIFIDKYIPNDSLEVWVLYCFPIDYLNSVFLLCEEKATS